MPLREGNSPDYISPRRHPLEEGRAHAEERGGQGKFRRLFPCFKSVGCLKDRCPLGERIFSAFFSLAHWRPWVEYPASKVPGRPYRRGWPARPGTGNKCGSHGGTGAASLIYQTMYRYSLSPAVPSHEHIPSLLRPRPVLPPPLFYLSFFFRCRRGEG